MKEPNDCDFIGFQHAWRSGGETYGFDLNVIEVCLNCGLRRTRNSKIEEWWSYSDGRPDEPIVNIRPV